MPNRRETLFICAGLLASGVDQSSCAVLGRETLQAGGTASPPTRDATLINRTGNRMVFGQCETRPFHRGASYLVLVDFAAGSQMAVHRWPKICEPTIVPQYLEEGQNVVLPLGQLGRHFCKANYVWNGRQLNSTFSSAADGKYFRGIAIEIRIAKDGTYYGRVSGDEDPYLR